MDRYVIAVKRDCREKVSPNWIGEVGNMLGLNLDESAGAERLVAAMTVEQRELIRAQFGELVLIELEAKRYPSESS